MILSLLFFLFHALEPALQHGQAQAKEPVRVKNEQIWGESSDGLRCRIRAIRNSYSGKGPLPIELELKFESKEATCILLPKQFDGTNIIRFIVMDKKGAQLQVVHRQTESFGINQEEVALNPNSTIKRAIDLSGWYDFKKEGSPYQIMAVMNGWTYEETLPTCWLGELKSNSIRVAIE